MLNGSEIYNHPSFTKESIAQLLGKQGCKNIWELTGNVAHQTIPIYFYDEDEAITRKEIRLRLDQQQGGVVEAHDGDTIVNPWVPCNSISFPQDLKQATLQDSVLQSYVPNIILPGCCSKTCGIDADGQMTCGKSSACACKKKCRECYHAPDCFNTVIRKGVYPSTFLCHTKDEILKLGVKAGQDIHAGSIIMPYIGNIYQGPEIHNGCLLEISDDGFTVVDNLYVNPVPNGGIAHFINDCGVGGKANVFYEIYQSCNSIFPIVRAKVDIKKGEWLAIRYGANYWRNNKQSIKQKESVGHQQQRRRQRLNNPKLQPEVNPSINNNGNTTQDERETLIVLRVFSSKLNTHLLIPGWLQNNHHPAPNNSNNCSPPLPPPPSIVRLLSDGGSFFPDTKELMVPVRNPADVFTDPMRALDSIKEEIKFKGILISHFSQNLPAITSKWDNWNGIRIVKDSWFGFARLAAETEALNK